ncbi:MAG: amidase family protein [Bacillota bacterium]|jgi:amidase
MNEGTPPTDGFVEETTIMQLQEMMASGKLTSRELVKAYLKRIALYDHGGPALNSVLETNPEALFTAEALDQERRKKGPRGLLHGIPILVKDNIDTGDMMHTSAGSLALADSYAPGDSFIVNKLREAGAIILGKANMTEWANFMTDNMPNGYSSRGGQVKNPYGPGVHEVGGSSSGSGAAVAANLVPASVGTETSGSILSPACNNSIVGIKPTVGLLSRTGVIPISHVQDTPGPLAKTVEDAAILLGVLAGIDQQDVATYSSEGRTYGDYTQFLDSDGLKGARIGIARSFVDHSEEDFLAGFAAAKQALQDAGACVIDVDMLDPKSSWQSLSLIYEFKPAINRYLSRLSPIVPVHSLKELVEFNQSQPDKMLKYGQTVLVKSEETSGTLTETEYILGRAREEEESRMKGIDCALKQYGVDALFFPHKMNSAISARAGYPSISVPAGYTGAGRPVGVTFTAGAYSEPLLVRFAYAFEQATQARKPPNLNR